MQKWESCQQLSSLVKDRSVFQSSWNNNTGKAAVFRLESVITQAGLPNQLVVKIELYYKIMYQFHYHEILFV